MKTKVIIASAFTALSLGIAGAVLVSANQTEEEPVIKSSVQKTEITQSPDKQEVIEQLNTSPTGPKAKEHTEITEEKVESVIETPLLTPSEQRTLFITKYPKLDVNIYDRVGVFKFNDLTEEAFDHYVQLYVEPMSKREQ